ncbi:MAG: prolipoprotein diacylglyceryl transferase [Pseudomonadota bacterium]
MQAAIPFPNVDPEILSFEIGGFAFALRWYALAYIVGLLIAWRLILHWARRPALWPQARAPMTADQIESLLTWVVLGVVLGGRLGFVLFYQPGYYLANPAEIPLIWQGGMSFHGGLLGVIAACVFFTRRNRLPIRTTADAMCAATPPALLLGRMANFINAELWGRPTDLPWGVIFPGEPAQNCPGMTGLCARHPSQLYEAGLEGMLLGAVCIWLVSRGGLKRPGLLSGVFLAGYGLARFVVEFFRQADAQFITPENPIGFVVSVTPQIGMTMGQLLSLPMVIFGLGLILFARRRA